MFTVFLMITRCLKLLSNIAPILYVMHIETIKHRTGLFVTILNVRYEIRSFGPTRIPD